MKRRTPRLLGTLIGVLSIGICLSGCTEQPSQAPYAAQPFVPAVEQSINQKAVPPVTKPTPPPANAVAPVINPSSAVPQEEPADVPLSNDNTYINSDGNEVHSPAYAPSVPAGATAICGDGTYSFSQHRSGTCSHHGGVAQWL